MKKFLATLFLIIQFSLIISAQNEPNIALNFDGFDDYVELNNPELGNFEGDFTISVWVKPAPLQFDTKYQDNEIVEKWSGVGSYPFAIRYLNQKSGTFHGKILAMRYDGTNNPEIISTHKINDGKWHNVIFTRNKGTLALYIDGEFSAAAPDNTKFNTNNGSRTYIGQRGNNKNRFRGEIDELRFWNLGTAGGGENLNGKFAAEDGLVAAFDFGDGLPNGNNTNISTITDLTNNYTGLLKNFVKYGQISNFVKSDLPLTNETQEIVHIPDIVDNEPPKLTLKNLESLPGYKEGVPGFMISTTEEQITIAGIATDNSGIFKVLVNNITAEIDNASNLFQANIILDEGRNPVKVVAIDNYNNQKEYVFFVNKKPSSNLATINTKINPVAESAPVIPKRAIKEKRIALVIGNSNYNHLPPLKNPMNDAYLMDSTLKQVGFLVQTVVNGNREEIWEAIDLFTTELAKDKETVGLFYYAGHGIQQNGNNYIVPINAKIAKASDISRDCYNMESLYNEIEQAKNNLNMIILDACRNNPIESFRSAGSGGLAKPEKQAIGTFIAFSTAPGKVASDGIGKNSIYTKELSNALLLTGKKIEDVFKKVKEEVFRASKETQLPWDSSSIFGDFYFNH